MGTGLRVRDPGEAAVLQWQGVEHLSGQAGDGQGLALFLQLLQAALGHDRRLVELPALQVIAQGLDAVRQGVALVLDPPEPVVAGPAAALRQLARRAPLRQALGGPAVHPGLAFAVAHHQREGREALQRRPHRGGLQLRRQHPRQPLGRQRQVGHRQLQQHRLVAPLAGDRQQLFQQHIPQPQRHRLPQPLLQPRRRRAQLQARGRQGLAQPLGDRRQPALPLAEQGIEKLQQPWMAADQPQGRPHLLRRPLAQAWQALHQLAGFGRAQGAQLHLPHPLPARGQGVAASEQQPAPPRRREQPLQLGSRIGIQKGCAAGAQVLLEVVEHEQQRLLGQQLAQEPPAQLVLQGWLEQQLGQRPGAGAALLQQGQAHLQADRPQVQPAAVAGDRPAILRQPLHHPARQAALAHPADAPQQHPTALAAVAQASQAGAQLAATAHQIANRQLGHRPR